MPDRADAGVVPPPLRPDGQPPVADAGPDAQLDPDAAPDAALADAAPDAAPDAAIDPGPDACFVDPDPAPIPPEGLADLAVNRELRVGGPLTPPAFAVADLDGDGAVELVVARGGRAEALGMDGRQRWSSAVVGLTQVTAVLDLDGDGRQEVVGRSARAVYLFDALTGRALWTSPERPFGDAEAPVVQVLRVVLGDADGDDLPDLYLTDSGCTGGGRGYGAFFSFFQGVEAPVGRSIITGPRVGGRCARWHTLADLTGDDRAELLRSDALGIDAFDPTTGTRILCGPIAGISSAILPHFAFDHDPAVPGRELAVFDDTRLLVMAPGDPLPDCPDDAAALRVRWVHEVGEAVRPVGSGAADLDGDGRLDLYTSAWRGDRWWLLGFSGADGAPLLEVPDVIAAGLIPLDDGGLAWLTLEGPARDVERYGALQLRRLGPNPPPPLWAAPIPDAASIQEGVQRPDSTDEFTTLVTLGPGPRVLLRQADPGGSQTVRLLSVAPDGQVELLPVTGNPGGTHRACTAGVCDPRSVVVALENGDLAHLDPALRVLNAVGDRPAARAPTGDVFAFTAFDGVRQRLVTLSAAGALGAADVPPEGEPGLAWRVQVGPVPSPELMLPGYIRPVARAGGPDLLVVRDTSIESTGWRALTADGRTLWLHTLDARWRPFVGAAVVTTPEGHADLVLRYDQLDDLTGLAAPCAATFEDAELDQPVCPDAPPSAHVITALDAETGVCRWRTALRPNRCANANNQTLSLVDADRDGRPELYATTTNVVVQLDPTTGRPGQRAELGLIGASGRGGGTLTEAADPPLLRSGGAGPIDAFEADLTLRWRAAQPEGLQPVAWIFRPPLVVDDQVWISPGRGWPIHRYPLDSRGEDVQPVAQIALADGALAGPEAQVANVRSLHTIDDPGGGIFATTDDGWFYVLDRQGALAWSRRLPALGGPVVVADLDGDGARELAIPLNDGRVQIADRPGPPPPRQVWDLLCPPVGTCDAGADQEETLSTTTLCGEWYLVQDVEGYDVRVVDENGAILRDFFDVGLATTVEIAGLALVPGARYALEVRSRWRVDGRTGAPRASNGIRVINDEPPTVELVAAPDRIGPGGRTTLTLRATDDDLLAGWSLIITTLEGAVVTRLGGGPIALAEFEVQRDWNGENRAKSPVSPGRYRVIASVVDRGRNPAQAEVEIEVCAGACP